MIDKGIYDKGVICNPSNCECDKSWDVGEHLDYKNCECRKKLVDQLVKECSENINEKELHPTELHLNKMIYNSTVNNYKKICSSCIVYIILWVIFFLISIGISSVLIYFHYFHWYFNIYRNNNLLNAIPFYIYMENIKQINIKNCTYYFF